MRLRKQIFKKKEPASFWVDFETRAIWNQTETWSDIILISCEFCASIILVSVPRGVREAISIKKLVLDAQEHKRIRNTPQGPRQTNIRIFRKPLIGVCPQSTSTCWCKYKLDRRTLLVVDIVRAFEASEVVVLLRLCVDYARSVWGRILFWGAHFGRLLAAAASKNEANHSNELQDNGAK